MKVRATLAVAAVALAIFVAMIFWLVPRGGVTAIVKNTGTTPLSSAIVAVTGKTYGIGDIPPNRSASVVVRPQGDSRMTIEYRDAAGTQYSLPVDCYLESGFRGSITVDVSGNKIAKVDHHTRVGPY